MLNTNQTLRDPESSGRLLVPGIALLLAILIGKAFANDEQFLQPYLFCGSFIVLLACYFRSREFWDNHFGICRADEVAMKNVSAVLDSGWKVLNGRTCIGSFGGNHVRIIEMSETGRGSTIWKCGIFLEVAIKHDFRIVKDSTDDLAFSGKFRILKNNPEFRCIVGISRFNLWEWLRDPIPLQLWSKSGVLMILNCGLKSLSPESLRNVLNALLDVSGSFRM